MRTALFALVSLALALPAQAQVKRPTVPVMIEGGTDLDPCALGVVTGLKVNGDGFLAVRAAPAVGSKMLEKLYNGRQIFTCDEKGDWIGVVYGPKGVDCNVGSPWPRTMAYTGPCRSGWAHRNWIRIIAG